MLKSTARPMNSTANATEITLSEPTASAAKPAVSTSPAVMVTRIAATRRSERSAANSSTTIDPTDSRIERSAPFRSAENWSSSSATGPVMRTRTPACGIRLRVAASRRISAVAVAPGSSAP